MSPEPNLGMDDLTEMDAPQSLASFAAFASRDASAVLTLSGEAHAHTRSTRNSVQRFLEMDVMQVARTVKNDTVSSFTRSMSAYDRRTLRDRMRNGAANLIQRRSFSMIVGLGILLNAIYIGLETDLQTDRTSEKDVWNLVELVFTFGFFCELCIRIASCATCGEFASDRWNIFDAVMVLVSFMDNFVLSPLSDSSEINAINALRVVRLLRLARLVRIIRLFSELWVLVAGILEAFGTLVWAWALLGLLIYVLSIFTTRMIGQHPSADQEPALKEYFGSMSKSALTLFAMTTTESWADVAKASMRAQPWTSVVFIGFLFVSTFAIMNVVVAVIVENTLDQAGGQREKFLAKQRDTQHTTCVKIYRVFTQADEDGNGEITIDEFRREIQRPSVRQGLEQLGIDMRQAENLFGMLDFDGSGSLDAEEFVGGMMKAMGPAKAKDVIAADCDLRRMGQALRQELGKVAEEAEEQIASVEASVRDLRDGLAEVARLCEMRWVPHSESLEDCSF